MRIAVGGLILLGVGAFVVTRGPVPRWLATGIIRDSLGANFDAKSVTLTLDGQLLIEQPVLTVPDPTGELGDARHLLSADRLLIDLSFADWLNARIEPTSIKAEHPVLRISQHVTSGTLNLAALRLSPGSGSTNQLPPIDAVDAVIEIGEHGITTSPHSGGFVALAKLPIRASLTPLRTATTPAGRYRLRIKQSGGEPLGRDGQSLSADGVIDLAAGAGEFQTSSIDLTQWTSARVPTNIRAAWQAMRMRGDLAGVKLRYARAQGVSAELQLRDVELNLPIAAGRPEVVGSRTARLEGVSGLMRVSGEGVDAAIDGRLEDLAINVKFRSDGASITAPYTCTLVARDFQLQKDPRLLWFAPPVVRRNLERFGGPTAMLDAQIEVSRTEATPEGPAPVLISGSIILRDGEAAFERFPYPVMDLRGKVRFDDDKVRIVSVRGRSPSGAQVLAEGVITPITDESGLDIRVTLTDVPIDEELRKAIDQSTAAGMLDLLFSQRQYDRLINDGLISTPQDHGAARRELQELDTGTPSAQLSPASVERRRELNAILKRPAFSFGGLVDRIDVHIVNDVGIGTDYRTLIDVRFGEVGVLPAAFGLPLRAEGMRVIVNDRDVTLGARAFHGLTGGRATLLAEVPVTRVEADSFKTEGSTRLRVSATDIPVDDLLLSALPPTGRFSGFLDESQQGPPALPDWVADEPPTPGPDIATLIRTLGIRGTVDCDALVGRELAGEGEFDATVRLNDVSATLPPLTLNDGQIDQLLATNVRGEINVNANALTVRNLTARLARRDDDRVGPPEPGDEVSLAADMRFGNVEQGTPGELDARVSLSRFDITLPVESLIGVVAPESVKSVLDARTKWSPSGRISADITLFGLMFPAPHQLRVTATGRGAEALEIVTDSGRLSVDQVAGTWTVSALDSMRGRPDHLLVGFDNLSLNIFSLTPPTPPVPSTPTDTAATPLTHPTPTAPVVITSQPAGSLALSGNVRWTAPQPTDPANPEPLTFDLAQFSVDQPLSVALENVRAESPLILKLARTVGAASVADFIVASDVRAALNASAVLTPLDVPVGSRRFDFAGTLQPLRIALTRSGQRIDVPTITGEATITPAGGRLDHLSFQAPRWTGSIDGAWRMNDDGLELDARIDAQAAAIEPDLLAILPGDVASALREAKVELKGGMSLQDGALVLRTSTPAPPAPSTLAARFAGDVRLGEFAAEIGLGIRRASGVLGVEIEKTAERTLPWIKLSIDSPGMIAGPVTLTEARGVMIANPPGRDGVVVLESLQGRMSLGRVSLRGELLKPESPTAPRRFSAEVRVEGVRFADLLRDIQRNESDAASIEETSAGAPASTPPPIFDPFTSTPPTIDTHAPVGLPLLMDRALGPLSDDTGDLTRGSLDGRVDLSGLLGDASSRRGAGFVRIVGGDVISVPLVIPLIKLTSLNLPLDERLDFFKTNFTINGPVAELGEIGLLSGSVAVLGKGSMTLATQELDLRLATRAPGVIPIIGDLLDGLRNQVLTTTVKGTLAKPEIGQSVLSRPRAFFLSLFGSNASEIAIDTELEERLRTERLALLAQPAVTPPAPSQSTPAPIPTTAPLPPLSPSRTPDPRRTVGDAPRVQGGTDARPASPNREATP